MATRWSCEFYVADHKDLQASTIAVDSTGTYALLAGRQCLFLKNLNKTSESLVKFHRTSKFNVGNAEWNPHPQNKELCALSCSQNVEILNINKGNSLLAHMMTTHTRTVTDINWHNLDPYLLASCSIDRFTYVWDMRDTRKPTLTFSSIDSTSQVKWNRYCGNVLATSHSGDIRLWDMRKGSAPVHYISPHDSTIYCIDWSRNKRNQLATTGQDCTVKFFNTLTLKQEHVTLTSVAPVWRARYMPYGNGMLMAVLPPQKHGDNSLLMWNLSSPSSPAHSFLGHNDFVLEFAWRPCDSEKSKYQLVTWSKDNTLRLWHGETFVETVCCAVSEESINNTDESEESQVAIESNGFMADISGGQDLEVCQAIEADEMMTTADMMLSSDSETDSSPVDVKEPPTAAPHSPNLLSHEFSCSDIYNIPKLDLELLDPGGRVCIASIAMDSFVIRLNIRFPLDYPNGVAPTFEFSSDTDIDPLIQAKLIKLVKHTASQRVKKNRTCLEQCLKQFVSTVQQLLSLGDEDIGSLIRAEGNIVYRQFLICDSFIPFPRMSGASFSNNGILICFGRKVRNKMSHSEAITPRNLTSLAAFHSDSPFAVTYQRTGHSGGTYRSQKPLKASVCLYDASALFPIRKDLAEKYVFESDDIVDICLRNRNVASLVGRTDLEQMWGLAALAAEPPLVSSNRDRHEDIPWPRHPLSLDMIRSMIEYYVNQGDVQTATMLCCAFGSKTVMPKEPEHKISNKSLSPEPEGYGLRHTIHQMEGAIEGYKLANLRLTRSNSWSDIYEESARIIEHTSITPSVHPSGQVQLEHCELYDTYKLVYADILQSWQLLHARAQVMKYISDLPNSHKGLDMESKCLSCKRSSNKSVCDYCKRPMLICIICRTPVLGLANGCYLCHHGGHTKHLQDWFSRHSICPTGCGCQCILPPEVPS